VLASGPSVITSGLPSAKFYPLARTSTYATGHIALTMDFSNWEHCYRFTHASFHKV